MADKRSLPQKFTEDVLPKLDKHEAKIAKELYDEYQNERRERMRLTTKWMKLHDSIEAQARLELSQ